MLKAVFKMSIVVALVGTTLACGRKETPPQPKEQETPAVTAPQPKEQEDPTITAVTALFKKWDQAVNSNDPNKLMEIIPNEITQRHPEETKKICAEIVGQPASFQLNNWNTSIERVVIENDEETKATVYVRYSATDLKTGKREGFKTLTSYPIIKEGGEWKLDIQRWVDTRRAKSAAAEPKPKSGLVISLSYEDRKYGYHICIAKVYNGGDKTESISPSNFVLVTDSNESIEAQIPLDHFLGYKNLLNLHILPKTNTSGYLFFKTASSVKYIVFLPTGEKIPISNLK
jgi:hypothetical protein